MMFKFRIITLIVGLSSLASCISTKKYSNALDFALDSKDKRIETVLKDSDRYQVQILFAEVNKSNDVIELNEHSYHVDDRNYFYPASTVKLPIAVLSLEKLNQMGIDYRTAFKLENDTLSTSFMRSIQEIFAVSDNSAFNRLYEFLGKDAINSSIKSKGIKNFRIAHRLSTPHANRLERTSVILNPDNPDRKIYTFNHDNNSSPLTINHLKKGAGFQYQERIIYESFDFSMKNYYPITSQYEVLKRVLYPQLFDESERFDLNREQRLFLLKSMSSLPKEVGYDSKEYYDSYGKFFLFGDSKKSIPAQFKIYNKVGYAYGTLTDCAYITDHKSGVEFIVIATILVNNNQIFNDNNYEYDQVGIPFLSALGKELYRYEKKRVNQKR